MKIKIDENVPAEAIDLLRAGRHDVETAAAEGLAGSEDAEIATRIRAEGRGLITIDLDFANVLVYPPADYSGLIVLRPREPNRDVILGLVRQVIEALEHESPVGALWIVTSGRLRIRKQ